MGGGGICRECLEGGGTKNDCRENEEDVIGLLGWTKIASGPGMKSVIKRVVGTRDDEVGA